jgi:hypothetical protein
LHCDRFMGAVPEDQLERLLDVEEYAAQFIVALERMDESDLQRDNLIDALIKSGAIAEWPDGTILQVDHFP